MKRLPPLVAALLLLSPARVVHTQVPASAPTATAFLTARAPNIDGRADDDVWRQAPKITGFRQFSPKIDSAPAFQTEFQVAYDARNLYVFTRMHDPHPDSIMHALSRRDQRGPSDQIKLIIDSYGDGRTGYEFAVNPDGVQRDYAISNDTQEDGSWNGVWDVATRVDSLGWTAEFRIPLSQLRYAAAESHTFGFSVWRDTERLIERSAWPAYVPTKNSLASQLGRLEGLRNITTDRRAELTPYIVTRNVQRSASVGQYSRAQEISGGADLKLGLTPNVTVDATVNPDFGQVEADPAVVNLSAFEVFFAERRPFFLEGTGLYNFGLNCYIVVDCSTNEGLFYSRRIGRSPTLRGLYGDASTPIATSVAAATKVTGRTTRGLSFGVLDAVTREVSGTQGRTVEPLTNFAVARAQQDFRGGESSFGVIATGVNRNLDQWTDAYLHRSAFTGGATYRHRFYKKQYELNAMVAGSAVQGSAAMIARTQRNGVHFYQQPGDNYALDTTRTSLAGNSAQVKFGKYGGGVTRFETSLQRQSMGFDVNDVGFLRRADVMDWSTWGALSFNNAKGIYRWAQVNGNHWETWNTSGDRLDNAVNVNGHMGLRSNWDVHLGSTFNRLTESYCDRCTRGGPLLRMSPGIFPWGGINTDSRKRVSGGLWFNLGRTDEGRSTSRSLSPSLTIRPSTRLQFSLGSSFSTNVNDQQWFGNFTDSGGKVHYAFARLDQNTVSMSLRTNVTFTRTLSFEFYGQPFVSRGSYTNMREVSATPRADEYAERFQPYTAPATANLAFTTSQLRTNSVVRWEYRPGSTMFFVWAHGRVEDVAANDGRSWTNDYRHLMDVHPDNTFLVKFAHWLNR